MKRMAIPAVLIALALAGLRIAGQETAPDKTGISAQIDKARTLIREKDAWEDTLHLLSPLLARISASHRRAF